MKILPGFHLQKWTSALQFTPRPDPTVIARIVHFTLGQQLFIFVHIPECDYLVAFRTQLIRC